MNRRQRGATIAQLLAATGASRATIYRDLGNLRDAGVPIACDRVNGEARYRLESMALPPLRLSALQLAALKLAKGALVPLAGTALAAELASLSKAAVRPVAVSVRRGGAVNPTTVALIDDGLRRGQQLRLRYRGVGDEAPTWRRVDPLGLRLVGEQLYLLAHDCDRQAPRTFKVPRITKVQLLDERSPAHPEIDLDAIYRDAVRIWQGDAVEVTVRLSDAVARFAAEWPLHPQQSIEPDADGAVIVRRCVSTSLRHRATEFTESAS